MHTTYFARCQPYRQRPIVPTQPSYAATPARHGRSDRPSTLFDFIEARQRSPWAQTCTQGYWGACWRMRNVPSLMHIILQHRAHPAHLGKGAAYRSVNTRLATPAVQATCWCCPTGAWASSTSASWARSGGLVRELSVFLVMPRPLPELWPQS